MPPELALVPARAPKRRRGLRRALAAALTALVVGTGAAVAAEPEAAEAATGRVQGTVFRDYNQNGVYNASAGPDGLIDDPLKGVTATAYNAAGQAVGSAVTNASGQYDIAINPPLPDGTPLRIAFSGYPAGFVDSFNGSGNRTSVQFTTVGATGVDFALHKTTDYSRGTGTPIITAVHVNGNPSTDNTSAPAITAILPTAAVHTAGPAAATTLATFGEVGAVWGTAIQSLGRAADGNDYYYVYASAVVKRHSGWTSRGIDGLYRLKVKVTSTGVVSRTELTSYDLGGVDFGNPTRDLADRLGTTGVQSLDAAAFGAAGTTGIGGIAYHDGRLYVVNINQRNIASYSVDDEFASTPTVINPGLTTNERPWAIAVHDDTLYLGVTNTTDMAAGAKVIARPVAGGTWSTVLTVPLNYSRGIAWAYDTAAQNLTAGQPQAQWHAWSTATTDAQFETLWTNSTVTGQTWGFRAWAQPILSGLVFDDGGNLILGITDRFTYQIGSDALWPNWNTGNRSNRDNVTVIPNGDILYAGRNASGALAIENLGTAASGGTLTATTGGLDVVTRAKGYGGTPSSGQTRRENVQHGGREFFEDSVRWDGAGGIDPNEGVVHDETALGAVALIPGSRQGVSTSFDAAVTYNAAGNRFLSLVDGHSVDGFDQYRDGPQYFGKGGGIGGVAVLLADAPVEIGNRVWYDADGDGIQDADEPAIDGAPVELWTVDAGGNPVTRIGSTTTATVNGQPGTYYFRSEDAPSGGTAGFVKNAHYVLVFPARAASTTVDLRWPTGTPTATQNRFAGLTWGQMHRTVQTVGGDTLIDSNPAVATGRALVAVGGKGQNDHSYDAGWVGFSTFRIEKATTGWSPPNGTEYTIEVTAATDFRGDSVLGSPTSPTASTVDTLSYQVPAGSTIVSTEAVLYGTTLTFAEPGSTSSSVVFTGNPTSGSTLLISPTTTAGGHLLKVDNRYTSITVTKALSAAASLPAGTTFPIEYTIGEGEVQTAEVAVGSPLTIEGVPYGQTVDIREPLTGPFSWGGYTWGTGTWTQSGTALTPDADGWVTVTAPTAATPVSLTLTNHPYVPPALPFAGGVAGDLFTIAGVVVLLLALGLGVWQLRSRMRRRA